MLTQEHIKQFKIFADRDPRYLQFLGLPAEKTFPKRVEGKRWNDTPIRFDQTNLCPRLPGVRFNPSIIENQNKDGYIFVYRSGWEGSQIVAVRLDSEFKPISDGHVLKLRFRACSFGREDPRLFRLNGKLHIMFIGVVVDTAKAQVENTWTNVCFARINEDTFEVEDRFHPEIPGRAYWEKNHAYFDIGGIAHAVYSISPHRIMRVEGRHVQFVASTPTQVTWTGGRMCGGASPVLVGDEWYHFFHGSTEWNGRRQYNMGLYTFENRHPYAIRRWCPDPLDVADPSDKHDNHCEVLFPGGAILKDGRWIIAQGLHDRWSEIRFYDAQAVESLLEPV